MKQDTVMVNVILEEDGMITISRDDTDEPIVNFTVDQAMSMGVILIKLAYGEDPVSSEKLAALMSFLLEEKLL